MTMTFTLMDLVGTAGVLLTLVAYGLLHADIWRASTLVYSLANALGSALIIASLVEQWNFAAFVLESCWLLISLFGAARSRPHHKRSKAGTAAAGATKAGAIAAAPEESF